MFRSYKNKTGKMLSFYEAILPLWSIAILFSTAIIWARFSPTEVLDIDPRAFMWTMGVVFSNITVTVPVTNDKSQCSAFSQFLI